MTCIVERFKTKKELKQHVEAHCQGPNMQPSLDVYISNPSPFPAGTFEYAGMVSALPEGKKVIVTNHPKRSWFAQIERKGGKLKVT